MELFQLIPAVVVGVGGIVWAVRLEGRVNTSEAVLAERERHNAKEQVVLTGRLEKIEAKLDTLLQRNPTSAQKIYDAIARGSAEEE